MSKDPKVDILTSRDEKKMRDLARDDTCDPAALFVLSQAPSTDVRAAAAENPSTPRRADTILAKDPKSTVRCTVARKIAGRAAVDPVLLPDKIRRHAVELLRMMIRDQEVRVRRVIADEIKNSEYVAKDIVLALARDDQADVCCPVLEFSPLLEDDDLISIIAECVHAPALEAVARRADVAVSVADKLVEIMDVNAVAALLRNPNAQIREDILDTIVEAAETVEVWHAPLAVHPSLSVRAIKRICDFIASSLMYELAQRAELDEDTRQFIQTRVTKKLDEENAGTNDQEAVMSAAESELIQLHDAGGLDAEYLSDAAGEEKIAVIWISLALLSGCSHALTRRILSSRNAKAITALCWKAGMPMWLARELQEKPGNIERDHCLDPNSDGGYPMTDDELDWHFALFAEDQNDDEEQDQGAKVTTSA